MMPKRARAASPPQTEQVARDADAPPGGHEGFPAATHGGGGADASPGELLVNHEFYQQFYKRLSGALTGACTRCTRLPPARPLT
jgi:hypothetical protein